VAWVPSELEHGWLTKVVEARRIASHSHIQATTAYGVKAKCGLHSSVKHKPMGGTVNTCSTKPITKFYGIFPTM
jgi:hypothetical protein